MKDQRARTAEIARINQWAIHEGWLLMNDGTSIQRDDSDDVGRGFTFNEDDSARAHVENCAAAGSYIHRRALQIIEA